MTVKEAKGVQARGKKRKGKKSGYFAGEKHVKLLE